MENRFKDHFKINGVDKISKELEGVISQMLRPLKGLSLNIVIEGLANKKVIPFQKNDEKDIIVLEKLKKAGTFKTHEDEVEAYAEKIAKDFYKFNNYSNIRMGFTEEQKNVLAEHAYQRYIKHRDE